MADDEQYDGQGQNQGAMRSTPSRDPRMQNNRQGGGGPCVGECIRKPKIPDNLSDPRFGTMIFAEVLGTFFQVFIGCGICMSYVGLIVRSGPDKGQFIPGDPVRIAFPFGITVATIAQITTQSKYNYKSGGKGSFPWSLAMSIPTVPPFEAIIIKMFLTFLLVLTVCGVCDDLRKDVKGSAPVAIGLTVFVCHVMGMQFTGSSINPARSIGPLVFEDEVFDDDRKEAAKHLYIYINGPMLGGVLAGAVYQLFFREKESGSDSRAVTPAK